MRILIYVFSFSFGISGLIVAFYYVLRTGKVVKGAFIGWGLSIVCAFIVSVVLPGFVALYDSEYSRYFPESIGVPGVMFAGLIPALLIAVVARLLKDGIEHWAKSHRSASSQSSQEKSREKEVN